MCLVLIEWLWGLILRDEARHVCRNAEGVALRDTSCEVSEPPGGGEGSSRNQQQEEKEE